MRPQRRELLGTHFQLATAAVEELGVVPPVRLGLERQMGEPRRLAGSGRSYAGGRKSGRHSGESTSIEPTGGDGRPSATRQLLDAVDAVRVEREVTLDRREVGGYFTNYDGKSDWHLVPGWLDGREVIAVLRDARETRPAYFMELTLAGGRVAAIRDFRYVPYIAREAAIELAPSPR